MSNELLDTLENKVFSAIETIELLRLEINELKDERKLMEGKVRELIERIDGVSTGSQPTSISASTDSTNEDDAVPFAATPSFGQTGTDY